MSTLQATASHPSRRVQRSQWSLMAFRLFAALVAAFFIIVIELWRKILIPWISYAEVDTVDYGWDRHAELFLIPDTAAALFQIAFGITALLLLFRPLGRSALVSWMAAGMLMISWAGIFTAYFAGTNLVEGALQAVALSAALSLPLVVLHPQRKAIIRGGAPGRGPGPGKLLRYEVAAIGFAGAGVAVGSTLWRISGGVFENPREDSVLSLVMFGLVLALGALLCWQGREGWKSLAYILNGMVAFALIAMLTIAVS